MERSQAEGEGYKQADEAVQEDADGSSSSSLSASSTDQKEGETEYFERKRFAPKDHKFKISAEIVHVCVKTLEKVVNEGGGVLSQI